MTFIYENQWIAKTIFEGSATGKQAEEGVERI
jgi:hypothetical protein